MNELVDLIIGILDAALTVSIRKGAQSVKVADTEVWVAPASQTEEDFAIGTSESAEVTYDVNIIVWSKYTESAEDAASFLALVDMIQATLRNHRILQGAGIEYSRVGSQKTEYRLVSDKDQVNRFARISTMWRAIK